MGVLVVVVLVGMVGAVVGSWVGALVAVMLGVPEAPGMGVTLPAVAVAPGPEVSVRADGALTAVLHGISHFQTAARLARLPAVRIVSVNARDGQHDDSYGTT